jgi:hypothetical protein
LKGANVKKLNGRRRAPVERVERWALSKLVPYARNPRLHNKEQIDQIAASMQQFGQAQLIVVDAKGEIIAGHGRVLAAEQLGWKDIVVGIAVNWTETQRRAYRIADNQLALTSIWDDVVLGAELQALSSDGFDLPLLGFDDAALLKLMSSTQSLEEQEPDREMSAAEKREMAVAWRCMVKEWVGMLRSYKERGFVSTSYTKGFLAVHFLRAKFFGDTIPSAATLAYTPHRVEVAGHVGSIIDGLELVLKEEDAIERLWFVTGGRPRFDAMVTGTLPFLSMRLPGEFPAHLARELYDEHVTRAGGTVLDPCSGWGGRMLGFMLSKKASRYIGFDTDPDSIAGVRSMHSDLVVYAPNKGVLLECKPFEDAQLEPRSIDFALTSPPYFNTEKYGGDDSSWRRYKTLEEWVDGFYKPLLRKTALALKTGGIFALQIGSQRYKLEEIAKGIAADCGFEYRETRATDMRSLDREHPEDGEVLIMLRKSDRKPSKKTLAVLGDAAEKYGRVMT